MTMVLSCGPNLDETEDDYFIRTAFEAFKGRGWKKKFAELRLRIGALHELFGNDDPKENESGKYGSQLEKKVYSSSKSLDYDLALFDYGRAPFPANRFSTLDLFSVLGKVDKNYAGFMLNFFRKEDRPTEITSLIAVPHNSNIFDTILKNIATNKGVYREMSSGEEAVNLHDYGKEGTIRAFVRKGELKFGAEGKPQNRVVRDFMNALKECTAFTPEIYLIQAYVFPLDFNYRDSSSFKQGIADLGERIRSVYGEKTRQYAHVH